jgi:hypothetical protein
MGQVNSTFVDNYIVTDNDGVVQFRMGASTGYLPAIANSTHHEMTITRDAANLVTVQIVRVSDGAVIGTHTRTTTSSFIITNIGAVNSNKLYFQGKIWELEFTGGTQDRHYQSPNNTDGAWVDLISAQNGTFSGLAAGTAKYVEDTYVSTDVVVPVITLLGDNPLTIIQGDTYTDPGFTASDNEDGDITANVVVTGTVDTATTGAYVISYNVSDAALNAATEQQRTVNVVSANGTINTLPIGLNNGQLRLSESVTSFDIYNITTGELIVRKTGLTTNATTAAVSTTDALLAVGTDYDVRLIFADGAQSIKRYTADS